MEQREIEQKIKIKLKIRWGINLLGKSKYPMDQFPNGFLLFSNK